MAVVSINLRSILIVLILSLVLRLVATLVLIWELAWRLTVPVGILLHLWPLVVYLVSSQWSLLTSGLASCLWPLLLRFIFGWDLHALNIFVQAVWQNMRLVSRGVDLVSLVVCVDISATIIRLHIRSGCTLVPSWLWPAVLHRIWPGRSHPGWLSVGLWIKHTLSSHYLLLLFLEHLLFHFGLLPVLVCDLGQDSPVLLVAPFLLILGLLVLLLYFLLDDFLPLSNKRSLEPLFEHQVAFILFLLFLKDFFLFFLNTDKLFVMDMHFLLIFPLKHRMGSLLHPDSFFLLFLDQCFKQVSLSLHNEFLPEFPFMILRPDPLIMWYFLRCSLQFQQVFCLYISTSHLNLRCVLVNWSLVKILLDHLFDLRILRADASICHINNVGMVCSVLITLVPINIIYIWIESCLLSLGSILVGGSGEPLEQPLVLLEELLVLVDPVVYTILVHVALSYILSSTRVNISVIEFENMLVSVFKLGLCLQIDKFWKLYSDWTFLRFLPHYFVNQINCLCRQLDKR